MKQSASPSQIRAARGLLDWTRSDLANQTGLSEPTIQRFENGKGNPVAKTQDIVERILELHGIEFLENAGVRIKPQGVEVLNGSQGLKRFLDDVYEYTRRNGGSIVQFGVDEKDFSTHLGTQYSQNYFRKMNEIIQERKDIKVRTIICEGDTNFAASHNEYRWISKKIFQAVPFYIYGKFLAIMDFHTQPEPTILRLNFPAVTEAYRAQFEAFWQMSKVPKKIRKSN